jgi:hypothetical protein
MKDFTIAAQVAIWIKLGNTAEQIRTKFPFGDDDHSLALKFTK